ncbi:MAG: hypothetical protein J1E60_08010 [Christensenellaceae bacterium]|nr:hypothetical protein [Christensenellaceae bacterium]
MDQKAIDCAVQHIKTFHRQFCDGKPADFGEPCSKCKYVKECNFDWLSILDPILSRSSVSISVGTYAAHQEHQETPGSYCERDLVMKQGKPFGFIYIPQKTSVPITIIREAFRDIGDMKMDELTLLCSCLGLELKLFDPISKDLQQGDNT